MKNMTYKRIYDSEECLSSLGSIHHRALFGGYSLSIDDTVFAMVAHGELYLRVCEQEMGYEVAPQRLLTLTKRGRPVSLNYYLVDESLWRDQPLLLQKSAQSLQDARNEKTQRDSSRRMKQLPNITYQLEMLLHEVGIHDPEMLKALGSATVWYRLRCVRKDLSISVLFALEGAILGMHAAIIPETRRQYLQVWAEMLLAGKGSYDE
ncbi:MAG: TfoX/Sxy family DNA transformation protein [Scandinavium sp.]|uniref:TfoX/Sxy family DNA transformation protein n=1 Tax=Scandinavium sp. TaxID=2830653 RepID=UPI003F3E390A